jgi:tripartite-type tricarboxylate transporter receptor subunit TctC
MTKVLRRQILRAITAAAILAAVSRPAAAGRPYPSRPIALINPFPVGGPLDTLARAMAERMGEMLGQAVIVENVTGASGGIGTSRVARAAPDGYTLGLGYWGTHVANAAIYNLDYDVVSDFLPIAQLARGPLLLVARKTFPANNLNELIAWLKANPCTATQGTAGVGTAVHVVGLLFGKEAETCFLQIPYRGVGPAMQDLLAGHLDIMFADTAVSLPQIAAGYVKAFAVTDKRRLTLAPEIPTFGEAGLPSLYFSQWYGLWAPKGTASDIIAKINAAVVAALTDPTIRRELTEQGMDVPPSGEQTPQALAALQRDEIKKWWPIIKAAGIEAQ